MQQHAHNATVSVDNTEHQVPVNKVRFAIFPVMGDDDVFGFTAHVKSGLPTETQNEVHDLNLEYSDADEVGGMSDADRFLTKDGGLVIEENEIVFTGATEFQGHGDTVKTRLPRSAVDLVWDGAAERNLVQNKHVWEGQYDQDLTQMSAEDVFLLVEDTDEYTTLEEVFSDFESARDDAHQNGDSVWMEGSGNMVCYEAGLMVVENDAMAFFVEEPDPSAFEIVDCTTDFDYKTDDVSEYALPGALEELYEQEGPFLAYNDGEQSFIVS